MVSSFLNNYFGFNKQQRNGLLVLAFISLTLLIARISYPYFIEPADISIQNLPLIERRADSGYINSNEKFQDNFPGAKVKLNLFVFNPNTVAFDQLLQLGFKEKTAKTFLKFRERGFTFRNKKDLQKVYGISDNFYAAIEPYILIESQNTYSKANNYNGQQKEALPVISKIQNKEKLELNTADSIALTELNGIGPSFAKRILKYKNLLGGYVSVEQLKEVYGFTEELFEKVKPHIKADASLIKKLDLNTDDFKTINKHPYLSYELTKSIFDWRKKTVITATNLKEIINDESVYNKLLPYFQFR